MVFVFLLLIFEKLTLKSSTKALLFREAEAELRRVKVCKDGTARENWRVQVSLLL